MTNNYQQHTNRWCLETTIDGGSSLERVRILTMPFRVGRLAELDLTIPSQSVSKYHAQLEQEDDQLRLRDLRSTNGTFVNRKRITEAEVHEGDIIHFAKYEFRLASLPYEEDSTAEADCEERGTFALGKHELSQQFVGGTRELTELLARGLITSVFQPIVTLPGGEIFAVEALGRGLHDELPISPTELFDIARATEREAELSRVFRRKAIALASEVTTGLPLIFLNTHPTEIGDPELVNSLREDRERAPQLRLVLEIHEGALAKPAVIAKLKQQLDELDIRLAFDDFGVGERFLQLAEVPPDYLKFDISLVKGIAEATSSCGDHERWSRGDAS